MSTKGINDEAKNVMKKILNEKVKFYLDKDNSTVIKVEYQDNIGAYRFESPDSIYFRAALNVLYRQETGEDEIPDFSGLLKSLCDDTIYNQRNLVPINHRVAGSIAKGRIALYLADKYRQIGVITSDGWKIYRRAKEKFIQRTSEMAQVKPVPGGDLLTLLRPYINLNDDDFLLLVIWIVQAFSRKSSHYALVISSPKGTGKSTLTKLLRSLIDPSHSDACLTSSSANDLKNLLANTFMACFDNTAKLSENFSNILCAAITGTKEAKRKLYSDCDQIILNLHNLVVLNGIDIIPEKSDLAERCLLFELQKIAPEKRMTDNDFESAFQRDTPAILGAIFDTLQKAMQILPNLKPEKSPRMADAYKEMFAIALALGISEEEFQRIFYQNIHALQEACAGNTGFVDAVSQYVKNHGKQTGKVTDVYEKMCMDIPDGAEILTSSASWFSRKLRDGVAELMASGVQFYIDPKSDGNHITIGPIR